MLRCRPIVLLMMLAATLAASGQTFDLNDLDYDLWTNDHIHFLHWITTGDTTEQYATDDGGYFYTIDGFWMSCTEITQDLWERYMPYNPSAVKGALLPVTNVSVEQVDSFMTILSSTTGLKWRLPTREEWFFAYHGGLFSEGYRYSGSNSIDFVARHAGNCRGVQPVQTRVPNEVKLYDMDGNVAEMVSEGDRIIYLGGSWRDKWTGQSTPDSFPPPPPDACGFRAVFHNPQSFKDTGL